MLHLTSESVKFVLLKPALVPPGHNHNLWLPPCSCSSATGHQKQPKGRNTGPPLPLRLLLSTCCSPARLCFPETQHGEVSSSMVQLPHSGCWIPAAWPPLPPQCQTAQGLASSSSKKSRQSKCCYQPLKTLQDSADPVMLSKQHLVGWAALEIPTWMGRFPSVNLSNTFRVKLQDELTFIRHQRIHWGEHPPGNTYMSAQRPAGSLLSHNMANPTKALFMAWMFITFMCIPWCLVQAEVSLHPLIKNLRNTLLTWWLFWQKIAAAPQIWDEKPIWKKGQKNRHWT